jgi:hypothetical protein
MALTNEPTSGSLIPCFLAVLVALPGLTGCKNEEACTKARNAASTAWKAVTETAGKNKVAPNIGLDELPPDKKGAHVEAWSTIEKQSDMIQASFMYDKITWNTADPALQKVNAAFDGYFAKDKFKTFETELKDADAQYKGVVTVCRE